MALSLMRVPPGANSAACATNDDCRSGRSGDDSGDSGGTSTTGTSTTGSTNSVMTAARDCTQLRRRRFTVSTPSSVLIPGLLLVVSTGVGSGVVILFGE